MDKPTQIFSVLWTFLIEHWHTAYAFIMTFIITAFRICYLAEEHNKLRATVECILCGLLAVASRYVFIHLNMNEDLAVAFGAIVAMTGVDKVRQLTFKFINKKVDK